MDFYREEMMKMYTEAVSPDSSKEELIFMGRLMAKTITALCDKVEGFDAKKDVKEKSVRREQLFKSPIKSPLKTITNELSEKENWSTPQKLAGVLEKTPTPNKLTFDLFDASSFKTPEKTLTYEETNSPSPSLIRKLINSPMFKPNTSAASTSSRRTIQNFNNHPQFKPSKPQTPKKNIFSSPRSKKPPPVTKKRPSPPKFCKNEKKMKQSTLKECLESRPVPTMDLTTHSAFKGGKTSSISSTKTSFTLNKEIKSPNVADLDETYFNFDLQSSQQPSTSKVVEVYHNIGNHNDTTIKAEDVEEIQDEEPKVTKVKKTILIETTQGREFDEFPKPPSPGYARKEQSVRKKADRLKLPGWDCPDCEKFYKNLDEESDANLIKFLKEQCSKHRYKYKARLHNTPEDYWDTRFPPTQECIRRGMILRENAEHNSPSK